MKKTIFFMISICVIFLLIYILFLDYNNQNIFENNILEVFNEKKEERIKISKKVPILMYHCIVEDSKMYTEVSVEKFENQIKLLKEKGYTTILFEDLIRFVEYGDPLPNKPICITFDDGYMDNYEMAYPILKKYNMKATIFSIGAFMGNIKYYKDTNFPTIPYFTFEQAKEMIDSGLISIQSHTYDMHQWPPCEEGEYIRENILKLDNETEEEYKIALKEDNEKMKNIIEKLDKELICLAYPSGKYDSLTNNILKECGIKITLTIEPGVSTITYGKPESLYNLKRINVYEEIGDSRFLKLINEK